MKAPVENVRVSAKGRDILLKVKRCTGLGHWNEICRIALCLSLANTTPPVKSELIGESAIDIEWKTFAGMYQHELAALVMMRAKNDKVDVIDKNEMADYFRALLERGILCLNNVKNLQDISCFKA